MIVDQFGKTVNVGDSIVFVSSYQSSTELTRGKIVSFTLNGNPRILKDAWNSQKGKWEPRPVALLAKFAKYEGS